MRLICPNCSAQYDVAEGAIPENGRDVQCANCSHIWYQERVLVLMPTEAAPTPLAPPFEEQPTPKAEIDGIFRSARQGMKPPAIDEGVSVAPPLDDPDLPSLDHAEPVERPEDTHTSEAPSEPATQTAPPSVDAETRSSVLDVLRQEAAYSNNRTDTPSAPEDADDFSLEIPELAGDEDQDDETASTEPPADTMDEPNTSVPDDAPAEPEVSETPSVKEAPYDASSVSSVKDEISEMFEKIERTKTPEDPTLASANDEETFNLRKQSPGQPDEAPAIEEETPTEAQTTDLDEDDADDREGGLAIAATGAAAAAAAVGTAAAARGKTVDVASFIERLKQAESDKAPQEPEAEPDVPVEPLDQTPAEKAYQASTELKHDGNSLVSRTAPTADAFEEDTPSFDNADEVPVQPAAETIQDVQDAIAPASALRKGKGKEVFADVAELETALEIEADKAEADKSEVAETAKKARAGFNTNRSDRSFMTGFYAACLVVALGTLVYKFAPTIKGMMPGSATSIDSYTANVDSKRLTLQNLYTKGGEPGLANFGSNAMDAILNR